MKTLTRAAAALLLASVAWACESAPLTAPAGARLDEAGRAPVVDPIDVQAATLTWLIDNKGAAGFDAYCVSTGDSDADPAQALLDRFAGRTPPVVPLSSCTVSATGDTYTPTGGPAQWFFLRDPVVSGRKAEIDAGFHINGRLAEFFHCTVRLTGQGWVVRECVLTGAA